MHLDSKKRQRRKQESFLFILMGLILLGLLISGYFLFVDKILPGISGKEAVSGTATRSVPAQPLSSKPGEATTVGVSADQNETMAGEEGQVVSLYFAAREKDLLVKELRKLPAEKMLVPLASMLVKELIRGPFSPEARRTIPEGTQLRSLFFHQGTFYVDFSREISENHPGGALEETMTVYSVVNTLTELDRNARVRILINGSEVESLHGHIGLRQAFTRYEPLFLSAVGG
ncbi:MAG: GerMN domain-containing protein [Candidatus Riflebacteria bacterium]|nr:GerMN domain-containing protein [Candidatus Riflebacteria bacterium]